MTLEFRIEHPDGTTETLLGTKSEETYEFEKMDMARLYTSRPRLNDVSLTEGQDEVYVVHNGVDLFGGILRDVLRGRSNPELVVDSFERLAQDAIPSAGDLLYDGVSDDTIVSDAISDIPEVTAGTVNQQASSTTFVFNYTSPAKRVRTVAEAHGGEVMYRPDKTLDYVGSLGTDRTESQTGIVLSPSEQNISGEFVPEYNDRGDITHLKLLGKGETAAQVEANVVPSADSGSYENKTTYNSSWQSGDRKIWEVRVNKDISDADTLAEQGLTLIEELNRDFVEVSVTVEDYDVNLGDEFTLTHPKEDIDRDLRAVKVTRVIDSDGKRYECVFSSRRLSRQTSGDEAAKDLARYNMAFEGAPVTLNTSGGRQPVNSSENYEFSVYYPSEVVHEHRVNLQVKGFPYRAYSSGASAGGGTNVTSEDNAEFTNIVGSAVGNLNYAWSGGSVGSPDGLALDAISVDPDSDTSMFVAAASLVATGSSDWDVWLENTSTGDIFPAGKANYFPAEDQGFSFWAVEASNVAGETLALKVTDNQDASSGSIAGTRIFFGVGPHTHTVAVNEHEHDPKPGLIEFSEYPSNCDVLVNGSGVGTSFGGGSSTFEETADISGMLQPGQWNTIEVTSDSLGHIMAHLDVDVYRQVMGRG